MGRLVPGGRASAVAATVALGTALGLSACAVGAPRVPTASSARQVPAPSPLPPPPVPTPPRAPASPPGPAPGPPVGPTPSPLPGPTATSPAIPRPSVASSPDPGPRPTAPPVTFAATTSPITPELAQRMRASWHEGCPVPLADLRYLTVRHWTVDGTVATGELVVHRDVAEGVVGVFAALFAQGYPIALMRLVDDFGADDDASMAADNTSAFSCRAVTGGASWSEHSYGRALDLNPVQNPYVRGATVLPPAGAAYLDRPEEPGVLHPGDATVRAFAEAGWSWGGEWTGSVVDYQHFSTSGR